MKQSLIGALILLGLLLLPVLDRSASGAQGQTPAPKQCGSCKKEVPGTSGVGDTCPHCGVKWDLDFSWQTKFKMPNFDKYKFENLPQQPGPRSGAEAGRTNRTPRTPGAPKSFDLPKETAPVALPAQFVIRVPPKADVEIEGIKMKQDGAERYFRSPPLLAGNSYTYEVKAAWKEDGKDIVVREKVRVSPGTALGLDFRPERGGGASLGPAEKRPAVLLIRVPAAAQVELEGAKTAQKGELRRFETQPLEMGSKYRYAVKATWKENGKDVVREQTVSFRPGEETTVDLRQPASAAK